MSLTFDDATEAFWRLPEVRRSPAAFRTALRVAAQNWQGVPLTVQMPSGHALRIEGEAPGQEILLQVKDFNFIRRILTSGDVGFAEGYAAGDWDTPDLPALLEAFSHNFDRLAGLMTGNPLVKALDFLRHALHRNSRSGSKKNIHAHYDLGNGFYAGWLDPSMTYSAALFDHAHATLEEAQSAKYAALARSIGIERHHKVLEIGCGWGGFAEYVGREIGADVEAVTISQAQYDYAVARIARAGLSDRVKIRLCDYRDVSGSFDRIVSIEMFEAVGHEYWPSYFQALNACLKPGGHACIQTITIRDDLFPRYLRSTDFIQQYIFPGGLLPSPAAFEAEARRAGLVVENRLAFGQDYAETLRRWRDAFMARLDAVQGQGFDQRFQRIWTFYLAYCEAAFDTGNTDVYQFTLRKPDA